MRSSRAAGESPPNKSTARGFPIRARAWLRQSKISIRKFLELACACPYWEPSRRTMSTRQIRVKTGSAYLAVEVFLFDEGRVGLTVPMRVRKNKIGRGT